MTPNPILESAMKLRNDAWLKVTETSEFAAFRALNIAVMAMGGANGAPVVPHADLKPENIKCHHHTQTIKPEPILSGAVVHAPSITRGKRLPQAEAAIQALKTYDRPLSTAELLNAIPAFGGAVGGDNPEINLSSSLSRDPRLRSIRQGGKAMWWFQLVPTPAEKNTGAGFDLAVIPAPVSVPSNQETADADNNT